jgi:hypothetical protein
LIQKSVKTNLFVGIGFRRSGSSSLHKLLSSFEGVVKPNSGYHYFGHSLSAFRSLPEYCNHKFPSDLKYVDLSVSYGYPELAFHSAQHLRKEFPEARVFAILRDPVERVISDLKRSCEMCEIPPSMSINDTLKHNPVFIERSKYKQIISQYTNSGYDVKIFKLENLARDKMSFISDLSNYLGCAYMPSRIIEPTKFSLNKKIKHLPYRVYKLFSRATLSPFRTQLSRDLRDKEKLLVLREQLAQVFKDEYFCFYPPSILQ